MKKLLFILLAFMCSTSYGQFTKGTRTVGLSLTSFNFSSLNSTYDVSQIGSSTTTNNNLNISITPSMGWFISEKVLVGGNLNFNIGNTKYTAGNNVTRKGNSYGVGFGGFGRYYLGSTNFMPYAQASLGAGIGSGKNTWDEVYTNYTEKGEGNQKSIINVSAGIGLGLTKMINKNTGFDINLGYQFTNTTFNYSSVSNVQFTTPPSSEVRKSEYKYTGVNNGVSFSIGFLVFLDPK